MQASLRDLESTWNHRTSFVEGLNFENLHLLIFIFILFACGLDSPPTKWAAEGDFDLPVFLLPLMYCNAEDWTRDLCVLSMQSRNNATPPPLAYMFLKENIAKVSYFFFFLSFCWKIPAWWLLDGLGENNVLRKHSGVRELNISYWVEKSEFLDKCF